MSNAMKRRFIGDSAHGGNEDKRPRMNSNHVESANRRNIASFNLIAMPPKEKTELMSRYAKYLIPDKTQPSSQNKLNGTGTRDSDSSDSSDSEADKKLPVKANGSTLKLTTLPKKMMARKEGSDSSNSEQGKSKAASTRQIKKPPKDDSSDDSDSDSEVDKAGAKKKVGINNTATKQTAVKNIHVSGKNSIANHAKNPTSSSSDDSDNSEKKVSTKPMVTKPPQPPAKHGAEKQKKVVPALPSSDESDSVSEVGADTRKPPAPQKQQPLAQKAVTSVPVAKVANVQAPNLAKVRKPSSSSSSESDFEPPAKGSLASVPAKQLTGGVKTTQQKNAPAVKVVSAPKGPAKKKSQSSSSEDSEEDRIGTTQRHKAVAVNKQSLGRAAATSKKLSSSESSESSGSDTKRENFASSKPAVKATVQTTKGRLGAVSKAPVGKIPTKSSSSSSDSDSEADPVVPKKPILVQSPVKKASVNAITTIGQLKSPTSTIAKSSIKKASIRTEKSSSDTSDSSDSEAEKKPQKSTTISATRLNGGVAKKVVTKPKESYSSSEDEMRAEQKPLALSAKTTPTVMAKSTPKETVKKVTNKKESSSSDDSDTSTEEGRKLLATKTATPPNKKIAVSPSKVPTSGTSQGSKKNYPAGDFNSVESTAKKAKDPTSAATLENRNQKSKVNTKGQGKKQNSSDSSSDDSDVAGPDNTASKGAANKGKPKEVIAPKSASPTKGGVQKSDYTSEAVVNSPMTRSRTRSSGSEHDGQKYDLRDQAPSQQRRSEPFRRVTISKEQLDPKFQNNKYQREMDAGGWGREASARFSGVKGKNFRHEMTKVKRGSYSGGKIDQNVKSIKFDD